MLFKSHALFFQSYALAVLAVLTGKAIALAATDANSKIVRILRLFDSHPVQIGDRILWLNRIRTRETAPHFRHPINHPFDFESNKTTAKFSLDGTPHLSPFNREAIHSMSKHSQASQVPIRLQDEDDKLALENLDNRLELPLNDDIKSIMLHKIEKRANSPAGPLQFASFHEIGIAIRLFVKRSHLTAHPTLA